LSENIRVKVDQMQRNERKILEYQDQVALLTDHRGN
jgi:hypothetical protein